MLGFTKYLQILKQYITNFAKIYFIKYQKSHMPDGHSTKRKLWDRLQDTYRISILDDELPTIIITEIMQDPNAVFDEDGEYLVAINVSWWLSEIVATFLAANSQLQYSEVSAVFAAG